MNEQRYTRKDMDENYKSGKVYYAKQVRQILESSRTPEEKLAVFARWAEEPAEDVPVENVSISPDTFSGDWIH